MKQLLLILSIVITQVAKSQSKEWYPYKNANGKWLFVNVNGQKINDVLYDSIAPFFNTVALIKLNNKWGVLDDKGNINVPVEFDSIRSIYNSYFIIGNNAKNGEVAFGLYTSKGIEILPLNFRDIVVIGRCVAAQLIDTSANGSIGMYNLKGKQLLQHEYSSISKIPYNDRFVSNLEFSVYVTKRVNNKTLIGGYNTSQEKWIFPCQYDEKSFPGTYFYFQPFINESSLIPITKELYLTIPIKDKTNKVSFDYYTQSGIFMYSSKDFDVDAVGSTYYYTDGDSIVGKTTEPSVKKLVDSLDLYILQFYRSIGIYDLHKGMIIDTGKYTNGNVSLDKKYISVRKFDGELEHFDLNGNIYPIQNKLETEYINGKWIWRDEEGNRLDLAPYLIQGRIFYQSSKVYIAKKDDKWGIINAEKEIILPFEFDLLEYNPYQILLAVKGNNINLFDENLNKIEEFRNAKWHESSNDDFHRFRFLKFEKNFSAYDLKTRKIILKKQKNSMSYDNGYRVEYISHHYGSDSIAMIQIYSSKKGWSYYDSKGELIIQAPEKSIYPMEPIIVEKAFVGILYDPNYNVNEKDKYHNGSKKYLFFDGRTLEGIDTVFRLGYDSREKDFYVKDLHGNSFRYSTDGVLLCKFIEMKYTEEAQQIKPSYFIIEDQFGTNIYDSNYTKMLTEDFLGISDEFFYFIGHKNQKQHIITIHPKAEISKPYQYLKRISNHKFTLAYYNNTEYDLYNNQGKLLYTNVTYSKDHTTYYVFRANGFEYWLTEEGIEYAKHKL